MLGDMRRIIVGEETNESGSAPWRINCFHDMSGLQRMRYVYNHEAFMTPRHLLFLLFRELGLTFCQDYPYLSPLIKEIEIEIKEREDLEAMQITKPTPKN